METKVTQGHHSTSPYLSYNFDDGYRFLYLIIFEKNVVNS